MTDITIPPEAVEAAALDLYYYSYGYGVRWEDAQTWVRDDFCKRGRAAIAAALKAWPEAVFAIEANNAPCILLPLPKETNDELL